MSKETDVTNCVLSQNTYIANGMQVWDNDSPEISGVYFWDNTFELETSSEEENIYRISDSFSEFIENLQSP